MHTSFFKNVCVTSSVIFVLEILVGVTLATSLVNSITWKKSEKKCQRNQNFMLCLEHQNTVYWCLYNFSKDQVKTLSCLVSPKMSHILKQTCSFQLSVYVSVTFQWIPGTKELKPSIKVGGFRSKNGLPVHFSCRIGIIQISEKYFFI